MTAEKSTIQINIYFWIIVCMVHNDDKNLEIQVSVIIISKLLKKCSWVYTWRKTEKYRLSEVFLRKSILWIKNICVESLFADSCLSCPRFPSVASLRCMPGLIEYLSHDIFLWPIHLLPSKFPCNIRRRMWYFLSITSYYIKL